MSQAVQELWDAAVRPLPNQKLTILLKEAWAMPRPLWAAQALEEDRRMTDAITDAWTRAKPNLALALETIAAFQPHFNDRPIRDPEWDALMGAMARLVDNHKPRQEDS